MNYFHFWKMRDVWGLNFQIFSKKVLAELQNHIDKDTK